MNKKLLLVMLLLATTILVLHSNEAVSQELTGDKGTGRKATLTKRLAIAVLRPVRPLAIGRNHISYQLMLTILIF